MLDAWLLAKGEMDWLKLIGPIILFVFYLVSHLVNRDRKGKPANEKSNRSVPRRPATPVGGVKRPAGSPQAEGQQKVDPLLAEIQKFLKQAKPERSGPRPAPPPKPVRVQAVRPAPAANRDESLARPLENRHLNTSQFGVRAAQMDDDMKRGDAEREQHFQQTFTHKLGRLADTSATDSNMAAADAAAAERVGPAVEAEWTLTAAIKPEDLRRAFIVNEIFQRPEHRW
jgi:hypothetical protein